jgi:signal transduction histidine kinase
MQLMDDPLLQCASISKRFGTLTVIDRVSFDIGPGEVVGLVGRTGAGKSVLLHMLAGLLQPSAGEAMFDGQRLRWPFVGRRFGIAIVPQTPILADRLDITANLFLGAEPGWPARAGWLRLPNRRGMDQQASAVLGELEMSVDTLRTPVNQLSSEQRQLLAIARALIYSARLVILDEPAALLSYGHQQHLLALIRRWQQNNVAVIFCSSNLDHIFAVADRVIVLNEGRKALDTTIDSTSREAVVAALIGESERTQLTPMIWALESYYNAREQAERLRHQQRRLERDLAVQDTLNQHLIKQMAEQLRSLDQANRALQDAQRRLMTERESERKALARELHDQVIQDLLSVNFQLEEIEDEDDAVAMGTELAATRESLRALIDAVRRICGVLRPPTIDSLGLPAALQSYTRDWSARAGVAVNLQIATDFGRLPEAIELSIFRIVQEGLANVRKHAQAQHVQVRLWPTSPRAVGIVIEDDGIGLRAGFDLAALSSAGHYGLLGISERVALLQGKLRIANGEAGGMRIEAEIPYQRIVA